MTETPYTQTRKPRRIKKHKESDAFSSPASNWMQITFLFGTISGVLLFFVNIISDIYLQIVLAALSILFGLI
jgi:hypothetical protein